MECAPNTELTGPGRAKLVSLRPRPDTKQDEEGIAEEESRSKKCGEDQGWHEAKLGCEAADASKGEEQVDAQVEPNDRMGRRQRRWR